MAAYREEQVPAYRWVVIGTLTASVSTALISIFIIGLLLPDISDELGLSPSQQGWLGASAVFGNVILEIPIALWLSRFRPWRIMVLSSLGIGVSSLLQGWSPTIAMLILGRIALGISFTASQTPRALLIQQWTPASQLPFTQGVVFGITSIAMGGTLFITPLLLETLGSWRDVLYIIGGAGILSTVVWTILGKERVTPEYARRMGSQLQSPLLNVLKYKQLWLLGLGMCSATISMTAFDVFWPTFAQNNLGVSLTIAGVTVGIIQLVAGPATFLVNAIPELARRQTFVMGACAAAIIGTNLGLLSLSSVPLLLLMPIVRGMSFLYFPISMIMVYQLPGIRPREVAVGIGFMLTSVWLGSAIGPLLVGFVEEVTGDLGFALYVTSFTPLLLVVSAAVIQVQRSVSSIQAR